MAWTASRVHDPPPLYWTIELLVREGSDNNTKEIEELVSLNRTVYRGVERVYKLWVCRVWVGFWHMVDLTLGTWDMETYWHWVYEVWKYGVWRHIDIGYVGYGDILTLGTWGMETYWHWVHGVWRETMRRPNHGIGQFIFRVTITWSFRVPPARTTYKDYKLDANYLRDLYFCCPVLPCISNKLRDK
jgi:hypothetical protein